MPKIILRDHVHEKRILRPFSLFQLTTTEIESHAVFKMLEIILIWETTAFQKHSWSKLHCIFKKQGMEIVIGGL